MQGARRGADALVPEQTLHGVYIDARLEPVRREGVAQRVDPAGLLAGMTKLATRRRSVT
jgi:hypothetical protein